MSEGGSGPLRVGMRPVRDWVMDRSMVGVGFGWS